MHTLKNYIYQSIQPYWKLVIFLTICLLYGSMFMVLSPYLLKQIIDAASTHDGISSNLWPHMSTWVYLYLGNWAIAMVAFRGMDWAEFKIYPNIRKDIALSLLNYLLGQSHHYFQNNFSGNLSNRINDMHNGIVGILRKIDHAFFNIMMIIIAIPMFFFTHTSILILFTAWVTLFFLVTARFSRDILPLTTEFAEHKSQLNGQIVDTLSNTSTVRSFANEAFEQQRIGDVCQGVVQSEQTMRKKILMMRMWQDILSALALATMFYLLVQLFSQNLITIGDFTFVFNLFMNVFVIIWQLSGQYAEFSEEIGKCTQALEIIKETREIEDADDATVLNTQSVEIAFENVSFQYNADKTLFTEKNVHIESREKVGLVGYSGSGKSTFANLISRLFDTQSGHIKINGIPIKQLTQSSLRHHISVIPQDPGLFHRSIYDNISYGNPEASLEDVIHAAKLAHCHEFIQELPEDYQTMIGERGIKLSGGQRQRIAIARAFLEKAPILILDEATSALDSVTEKMIQDSLDQLMKDHTTIVIAHRLSTLAQMDRILVFDQGVIIEQGSHESLLNKNGAYAKMWQMQSGGFLPEDGNT